LPFGAKTPALYPIVLIDPGFQPLPETKFCAALVQLQL
jgi:hypothetical protein